MEDLWLSFGRKMEESRERKRRVERRPVRGVNVAHWPAAGGGHDHLQGQRSYSGQSGPARQHQYRAHQGNKANPQQWWSSCMTTAKDNSVTELQPKHRCFIPHLYTICRLAKPIPVRWAWHNSITNSHSALCISSSNYLKHKRRKKIQWGALT